KRPELVSSSRLSTRTRSNRKHQSRRRPTLNTMDHFKNLPEDIIVDKITTEHLHSFADLIAFSGVCTKFRSSALNRRGGRPCLPGLLFSGHEEHGYLNKKTRKWITNEYSALRHEFVPLQLATTTDHDHDPYSYSLPYSLPRPPWSRWEPERGPEIYKKNKRIKIDFARMNAELSHFHIVSSKDGWLVLVLPEVKYIRRRCSLQLFNPFTGASVLLPPLVGPPGYKQNKIYKVILSSSPEEDDSHVIILFQSTPELAWCKVDPTSSSSSSWTFSSKKDSNLFSHEGATETEDVSYFGGKLYLVDKSNLHVIDNLIETSRGPTTTRSFPFSPAMLSSCDNTTDVTACKWLQSKRCRKAFRHLCELNGQVLVTIRRVHYCRVTFHVYTPMYKAGGCYWKKVWSLDGYSMFLGSHQSFCLHNDKEDDSGNRIFFAFNFDYYDRDIYDENFHKSDNQHCGVFRLGDQEMESSVYGSEDPERLKYNYFWFLPMPWNIQKHREVLKGKETNDEEDEQSNSDELDSDDHLPDLANNRFAGLLSLEDELDKEEDDVLCWKSLEERKGVWRNERN
ncbi:hypothetical protein LINGRAHAP2_LOCUS22178, partial [Linum grandiflorum]